MSDTAIAFAILPLLVLLTALLECTRVGCTRMWRKVRQSKPGSQIRRPSSRELLR